LVQDESVEVRPAMWLPQGNKEGDGLFAKCDIETELYVSDFGPLEIGAGKWWLDMPYQTALSKKKLRMIPRRG
jgi:hypothetical protein